ncbi:MAG TPA: hypothetical protein VF405_12245 [Gammaproteobacteria bacterium]
MRLDVQPKLRVELDRSEEEARVDEEARDGLLDACFEAACLTTPLVEAEQSLELGVAGIHGPPICERREAQQDLARARRLAAIGGMQRKMARRLGVSPAPVASNGPWISMLSMPPPAASAPYSSLTPSQRRSSTKPAVNMWGPAAIRRRNAVGSSTASRSPSSVTSVRGGAQKRCPDSAPRGRPPAGQR